METTKGLYALCHGQNGSNDDDHEVALCRLEEHLEAVPDKMRLFCSLIAIPPKEQQQNGSNGHSQNGLNPKRKALSESVRNSVLMLSERGMKSHDLRIRMVSMDIWSLILNQGQKDEMLQIIGFDEEKDRFSQSEQFENVVIGVMRCVLKHFTVKFHKMEAFDTEEQWLQMRSKVSATINNLLFRCFVLCPLRGMETIGQFTVSVLNMEADKENCM